jgi:hypothetical protein
MCNDPRFSPPDMILHSKLRTPRERFAKAPSDAETSAIISRLVVYKLTCYITLVYGLTVSDESNGLGQEMLEVMVRNESGQNSHVTANACLSLNFSFLQAEFHDFDSVSQSLAFTSKKTLQSVATPFRQYQKSYWTEKLETPEFQAMSLLIPPKTPAPPRSEIKDVSKVGFKNLGIEIIIDGVLVSALEDVETDDFCLYACSTSQSVKDRLSLLTTGVSTLTVRLYRDMRKVQQGVCGVYMGQISRIIDRPLLDGNFWRRCVFFFQTRGNGDMRRFLDQKTHAIGHISVAMGFMERHESEWRDEADHRRGLKSMTAIPRVKYLYSLNGSKGSLSQGPAFAAAQNYLLNARIGLVSDFF